MGAAHTSERREDLGLLHHPPGQGGLQRRQAKRAILDYFNKLPPAPKRSTGPNWVSRLLPTIIRNRHPRPSAERSLPGNAPDLVSVDRRFDVR